MAAPVWLSSAAVTPPGACVTDLALAFAGIVVLGIADSAASAIGRRFGRRRILGTRKTLEGTLGGVTLTLAAWAAVWPLCRCGATGAWWAPGEARAAVAGALAQACLLCVLHSSFLSMIDRAWEILLDPHRMALRKGLQIGWPWCF